MDFVYDMLESYRVMYVGKVALRGVISNKENSFPCECNKEMNMCDVWFDCKIKSCIFAIWWNIVVKLKGSI